ncbi:tRNA dimethylallyltransferase [Brevinematales bacterium NS]|nr:tRNA (adenosine(37)-N6)-dimethylallyltransferase MiaA [Brevinematales bacterium]QJR21286.1 tRNA dimethylallyltransferase [Brevinematales bacterium NS]
MSKPFVLAIVGPTASGKSEIAFELARQIDGEIISCDSVQVYRGLDIGSAKPPQTWRSQIPHHCIDLYDPVIRVSAGLYKQVAEIAIQDIWKRGKIPIVVGGTGLYFNALFYGLFEGPPANQEKRLFYQSLSLEELRQRVENTDPEWFSQNETKDRRRLVRVLEVFDLTGEKLSSLQKRNKRLDVTWHILAPDWPRETLYNRINERVLHMIAMGLIDETIHLRRQWGKDAYGLQSLGYKQVGEYLDGLYDRDTMIATIQQETRRYAKRQLTWFRKNRAIHWFSPESFSSLLRETIAWIEAQPREGTITYTEGSLWP